MREELIEKVAGVIRVHGRISHAHLREHIRNGEFLNRTVRTLEQQERIYIIKETSRETLYRRKGSLPEGSIPDKIISKILYVIINPRKFISRTSLMMKLKIPQEDMDSALAVLKALRVVVEKKGERRYYSWREK